MTIGAASAVEICEAMTILIASPFWRTRDDPLFPIAGSFSFPQFADFHTSQEYNENHFIVK